MEKRSREVFLKEYKEEMAIDKLTFDDYISEHQRFFKPKTEKNWIDKVFKKMDAEGTVKTLGVRT